MSGEELADKIAKAADELADLLGQADKYLQADDVPERLHAKTEHAAGLAQDLRFELIDGERIANILYFIRRVAFSKPIKAEG